MKRDYTIPLRKAFAKKPKYKRTPTAVRAVRAFLAKHMKVEEVRLGKQLNLSLWARGIKNPPPKISVTVEEKDGIAYAELKGKVYDEPTKDDLEKIKEQASKKKKKEEKTESVEEKIEKEENKAKPAEKKASEKVTKK